MARKNVEVAAHRLNIDVLVNNALASIHKQLRAKFVGQLSNRFDGQHSAQNIGHMRHGHDFGLGPDNFRKRINADAAIGIDRHNFDHRAGQVTNQLPRHNIGMML